MLSKVFSAGLTGIDAYLVEVEVDIAPGLATWNTVGLPESSVRESRDRIIGAIRNSGYEFQRRRITINLAPANVRKGGTAFDLPMAAGLLASSGLFPAERLKSLLLVGELSLQGEIKPILGALAVARMARKRRLGLVLPGKNLPEAAVVGSDSLFGVSHLSEVVGHLTGEGPLSPAERLVPSSFPSIQFGVDFSEVRGQVAARRAVEIAAAGGHNLLMCGPPGSGKTMLAERLPTILPPMGNQESLEATQIYSAAGFLDDVPLIAERPFRAPHHLISDAGMAGGGDSMRPGEASLAHNGVLFLDELPEFRRNVLELLRQPLESGRVTLARAEGIVTYPARFMLVGAMNPCRCGYVGSGLRDCICTPQQLHHYRTRLSGPLLDRLDLRIELPPLRYGDLAGEGDGESSETIRGRVLRARAIQGERFTGLKVGTNAQMQGRLVRRFCDPDSVGGALLARAMGKLGLSARGYDRILKVSRTIADLEGSDAIRPPHIAEAIHYRMVDGRD